MIDLTKLTPLGICESCFGTLMPGEGRKLTFTPKRGKSVDGDPVRKLCSDCARRLTEALSPKFYIKEEILSSKDT